MWSRLLLWWKRYWLRVKLEREYRRDAEAVAEARAKGATPSAVYDLQQQQHFENLILEDELDQLDTRIICKAASRFRVPIPNHSDKELWEESSVIGGWQLTTKGFAQLRSELRKEKNERWQYVELRTKVIIGTAVALTGLIGALIGLKAIWK